MTDHHTTERRAFLAGTNTAAEKLARAKEWLGSRYVFHPANAVPKAPHKTPDIAKADVAKTISRYLARATKREAA